MIAAPTVMCAASLVKNLLTGNLSCSWPDSSLACAITSIGKTNALLVIYHIRLLVVSAMSRTHTHSFPLVSPLPRVVYVFGSHVKEPPTDITPTFLTTGVLSTLRQADFVAHSILRESGTCVYPSFFKHCRLLWRSHYEAYVTRVV